MHILICDDDLAFAEKIQKAASAFFAARSVQTDTVVCTSAEQVLDLANIASYQLAFLDVRLANMNGIKLGRILKNQNPKIVLVYVSAYIEFAPQGYTVSAFRYVLKRDLSTMLPPCLEDVYVELFHKQKYFLAHIGREVCRIPYDSIYYFQSAGRQVHIFGEDRFSPICMYYGKLSELPKQIYDCGFLRISRSDVVNMRYAKKITAYQIQLDNGVQLGVSRRLYATIYSDYLEWKGQYGEA